MFWRKEKIKNDLKDVDFSKLPKNLEVNCLVEIEFKYVDSYYAFAEDKHQLYVIHTSNVNIPSIEWNYDVTYESFSHATNKEYKVFQHVERAILEDSDEREDVINLVKGAIEKDVLKKLEKKLTKTLNQKHQEFPKIKVEFSSNVNTSGVVENV